MWTVVRFELRRPADYAPAFEILAGAGFRAHRRPSGAGSTALPAAVVRDLLQDPAVVSRAVFEALDEGGLGPVAVSAAHVDVAAGRRRGAPLAPP